VETSSSPTTKPKCERLRYVNYCTTTIKIGAMTVPAGSAANPYIFTVQTITPQNPASPGYLNSVITFGPQICVAGGLITTQGFAASGNSGTHNVTCWDVVT